jgi:hypothetical protein
MGDVERSEIRLWRRGWETGDGYKLKLMILNRYFTFTTTIVISGLKRELSIYVRII